MPIIEQSMPICPSVNAIEKMLYMGLGEIIRKPCLMEERLSPYGSSISYLSRLGHKSFCAVAQNARDPGSAPAGAAGKPPPFKSLTQCAQAHCSPPQAASRACAGGETCSLQELYSFPISQTRYGRSFSSLSSHAKQLACFRHAHFVRWCRRRDLNSHGFPRTILSRVRIPIPPLRHYQKSLADFLAKNKLVILTYVILC